MKIEVDERVAKLFTEQGITLFKIGDDVSICCGSTADAEAVYDWLERAICVMAGDCCTCHERDGSYVCSHCFDQGFRGHMQRG